MSRRSKEERIQEAVIKLRKLGLKKGELRSKRLEISIEESGAPWVRFVPSSFHLPRLLPLYLFLILFVTLITIYFAMRQSATPQPAPSDKEFLKVVKAGNLTTVRKSLARGANPNAADENGATALMWAAKNGNLDIVKVLVARGADPLKKGAIYTDEKKESYYGNFLCAAAGEGHDEIVRYGIEKLNIPVDDREIYPKDGSETGWTALMWAADNGYKDICELLISKGADVNAKENDGWTALMAAAESCHKDVCELLISKGADVNAKNKDGWTALYWAARNQPVVIGALLKAGADVNAVSSKENGQYTPLMVACWDDAKDSEASVKALLAAGADVNAKNKDGWTALHWAARYQPVAIGALLKAGADVNAASSKENGQYTPLMAACFKDAKDSDASVRALLAAGANVNAKDYYGRTALMFAAYSGHKDVCEFLISKGADVNAKTNNGWTALMEAAAEGHKDICKLLISKGAEINARNDKGKTALKIALEKHKTDVANYLRSVGGKE